MPLERHLGQRLGVRIGGVLKRVHTGCLNDLTPREHLDVALRDAVVLRQCVVDGLGGLVEDAIIVGPALGRSLLPIAQLMQE